jgi:hypothetical protein
MAYTFLAFWDALAIACRFGRMFRLKCHAGNGVAPAAVARRAANGTDPHCIHLARREPRHHNPLRMRINAQPLPRLTTICAELHLISFGIGHRPHLQCQLGGNRVVQPHQHRRGQRCLPRVPHRQVKTRGQHVRFLRQTQAVDIGDDLAQCRDQRTPRLPETTSHPPTGAWAAAAND